MYSTSFLHSNCLYLPETLAHFPAHSLPLFVLPLGDALLKMSSCEMLGLARLKQLGTFPV